MNQHGSAKLGRRIAESCYRPRMRTLSLLSITIALACSLACRGAAPTTPGATAADARKFLDTVNDTMHRLGVVQNQAGWVQQTYITDDTEALAAHAEQEWHRRHRAIREGRDQLRRRERPPDVSRELNLLKLSLTTGHALRPEGRPRS